MHTCASFIKGEPGFIKGEPGLVKGEPGFIKGEPRFIKGEPGFIKGEPRFINGAPRFIKGEPRLIKGEPGLKGNRGEDRSQPENVVKCAKYSISRLDLAVLAIFVKRITFIFGSKCREKKINKNKQIIDR